MAFQTPLSRYEPYKLRYTDNEVEKDSVDVFCRIRPAPNPNDETCVICFDDHTVKCSPPETSFAFRNGVAKEQYYKFQHVFGPDTSQKEFFDFVAKPLVSDLLNRKNGLVFAYGNTGSGKTYTLEGVPQDGGIITRTVDVIFNSIQGLQAKKYVFKPDCMNGFDVQSETDALFDCQKHDNANGVFKTPKTPCRLSMLILRISLRNLQSRILREDGNHNMYVHNCREVEIQSPDEAFQAPLDANGEEVVTDKEVLTVSQLSLVDLAGSERASRTKALGDRLKEAGNINTSLMTLRNCIEILRENQLTGSNKLVPYRDSKLTHYFKNFFDGDGKVKMVVCVNPSADDYDEILPVMKFAELASEVEIQKTIRVPHNLGFTPGRRQANLIFKEARRRLQEEAVMEYVADPPPFYSLGPSWPQYVFSVTEGPGDIIQKLCAFLQNRHINRENLIIEAEKMFLDLKSQIEAVEKENIVLVHENKCLRSQCDESVRRTMALESRLLNAEAANESLKKKCSDYQLILDERNCAKEEVDMLKRQGHIDRQRLRARHNVKLNSEKENLAKRIKLTHNDHKD